VLIHFIDLDMGEPPQLKVGFPRRFDKKGKFGGPQPMVKDVDLEDQARDNEACALFGGQASEDDTNNNWFLLRTERRVRSRGAIQKAALVQIGLEDRERDGNDVAVVWFYTGFWRDSDSTDGPSEDDELACTSAFESSIPIGSGVPGGTGGTATVLEKELEKLTE
jgi:hypothetical protein